MRCAVCWMPLSNSGRVLNVNPIGKQAQLHVVDYRISQEFIPPAIGDVSLLGLGFLLLGSAQKIVGGEPQAVRSHDGHEHVTIVLPFLACGFALVGIMMPAAVTGRQLLRTLRPVHQTSLGGIMLVVEWLAPMGLKGSEWRNAR